VGKRKMKKIILLLAIAFSLALHGLSFSVYAQPEEPPAEETEPSVDVLHEELEKTLKKVKTHYERVQDSLEKTGVGRDPTLEAGIKELEKDRNSTIERLEGLEQVLLEAGEEGERESEDPPDVDYEKIEEEFMKVLNEMQAYIEEREEYWADIDIDSQEMLEEELAKLMEEQEVLKEMVDSLAAEIDEVWEEVKSGWSDKLQEWQDLISDLFSGDE
jgi:hypothetical protein